MKNAIFLLSIIASTHAIYSMELEPLKRKVQPFSEHYHEDQCSIESRFAARKKIVDRIEANRRMFKKEIIAKELALLVSELDALELERLASFAHYKTHFKKDFFGITQSTKEKMLSNLLRREVRALHQENQIKRRLLNLEKFEEKSKRQKWGHISYEIFKEILHMYQQEAEIAQDYLKKMENQRQAMEAIEPTYCIIQ